MQGTLSAISLAKDFIGYSSRKAFIGYLSRKGRKGAKNAKLLYAGIACCYQEKTGEKDAEREEGVGVRRIIVFLSRFILFSDNLANNNPFPLPFAFFAPLRPLRDELERQRNGVYHRFLATP